MLDLVVSVVPEGLEEHYKEESDGSFHLDVTGVVSQDSFDDLQDTNTQLSNDVTTAKAKVKQFRENNVALRKEVEAVGNGEGPQVDVLINTAVSEMKTEMQASKDRESNLQHQLEEVVLSDRVKEIAIQNGVHESALPDIVTRARAVFTVKDGKPIPKDENSRDGEGNVLSPETWIKKLEEGAPHLFKASNGSGAQRPAGFGGASQKDRSSMDKIRDGINRVKSNTNKNIM